MCASFSWSDAAIRVFRFVFCLASLSAPPAVHFSWFCFAFPAIANGHCFVASSVLALQHYLLITIIPQLVEYLFDIIQYTSHSLHKHVYNKHYSVCHEIIQIGIYATIFH